MSTFEYIFLVGSGIAAVLGILLVAHTLLIFQRQRKGLLPPEQQVDVKIFGAEIHGGRPLVIFVIGVILIVFPLKFSVDVLKPAAPHHPAPSIVPKPINYVEIAEADDPTYEGVHFLKDIRVIDLRSRIPVPKEKKGHEYSPVTWTRYTLLKKLSPHRDFVDFEFGTTGFDVYVRCLTHAYVLRKVTGPHFHGKEKLKHTWQIRIDMKDVNVNDDLLIINEATYWNAFSGERTEWAAMTATEKTDVIAMVILFPKDKPFKTYTLYSNVHGLDKLLQFRGEATVIPSENNQVLLWRIKDPKEGYTYQINWTW